MWNYKNWRPILKVQHEVGDNKGKLIKFADDKDGNGVNSHSRDKNFT